MPGDGTAIRDRILDAAQELVIEYGFAGTSVDRVLATAHASKGAFFHHFPTKNDLGQALVERYVDADLANLRAALAAVSGVAEPVERALAFVRFFEDRYEDLLLVESGCLYISVLAERDLADAGTDGPIRAAVTAWRDAFAILLREALGHRADQVDVDALSDHLFTTFEGAFLLCRSTGDPQHMRRQLAIYRELLAAMLR